MSSSLPTPPTMPPSSSSSSSSLTNNTSTIPSFSSSSSSNNILSTKVQRALQVRTDTPAMTNALDSLAALHHNTKTNIIVNSNTNSNNNNSNNNIDARNVRNAIEEDALYQAKLLEKELHNLVSMVGSMRGSIQNVLHVAESVGKSLETGVMVVDSNKKNDSYGSTTTLESSIEENKRNEDDETAMAILSSSNSNSLFEQERKLASLLADAFHEREDAMKRYEAISEFLEKYDLDEKDSYLLETYNFEDIFEDANSGGGRTKTVRFGDEKDDNEDDENNGGSMKNGNAFLNALERVTKIRKELSSSFDDDNTKLSTITSSGGTTAVSHHLGATSAMRMVESLASKQERAFERLYHFLHNHLDLSQTASMAHVPTSSNAIKNRHMANPTTTSGRGNNGEEEDGMDESLGHPFVRRALIVLRHVPAYYTHTLELIATSRRSEVTRKFLLALTSGYNGMAPIEMKAHDPVNYVGDMLAFVFRTVSVESELAKGLVLDNIDGNGDGDNPSIHEDNNDSTEFSTTSTFMSAPDVLNDALSGVARPLKSRLLQVIGSLARRPINLDGSNNNDYDGVGVDHNRLSYDGLNDSGFADDEADTARIRLAHLFSICGLMLFYRSAIGKAVQKLNTKTNESTTTTTTSQHSNPLINCLSESLEDAAKAYVASLKVYCAMLDHLASISNESQANLCQTLILRLCDVRATSPGFGPDFDSASSEEEDDENNLGSVSASAIEALSLEFLCNTIMETIIPSCCDKIDDIVSIKAALNGAKKAGLASKSVSKWEDSILKEEEKLIENQIRNDTNYVLDECGLGSIASALESMKAVYIEGMVISSHPGLSEQSLQDAMKKFYASLIDPPFPSYDTIKDPVLRKRSRNKIASNVADMYEEIYNLVSSEKGGYSDLSFLGHSPEQVRSLIINS